MKISATKYTTTYTREITTAQICAAAKAAFIQDLGGEEGLAKRGLSASAIKINTYSDRVKCTVTSKTCALGEPTQIVFAEFESA